MKILPYLDGLLIILLGMIYGLLALQIEHDTVVTNNVGADVFPVIVAILIIMSGAIMIIKGENCDHHQVWPPARVWLQIGVLAVILCLYSIFFESIGFVISNTVLCVYIGMLVGGKLWKSLIAGLLISIAIVIIFSMILEINLPSGVLGFLDDIIDPLEP